MRNWKIGLLLLALFVSGVLPARAANEIVVANRYLLANKTSHAHLFLYREDGKFLRQLTNDNAGQDHDPVFAPDGETIVWTRELSGDKKQIWSITPRGGNLKRLKIAPAWYPATRTSEYFASSDDDGASENLSPAVGDKAPRIRTPDGKWEIVLRETATEANEIGDSPGHGAKYVLRDLKTGKETDFGKLPGFFGVFGLLQSRHNAKQHFLWEKNLHAAFFDLHLDSTGGDTAFALDFLHGRLVRLSPNWAAPTPLAGESAFLSWKEFRYVPIPNTKKTANCRYVERFDSNFHRVRYARTDCTITYGASMYRAGQTPRVISIKEDGA